MARWDSKTLGAWLSRLLVFAFLASLVVWIARRDTLPWTLHIATGERGGLYYHVGRDLMSSTGRRTRRKTVVHTTRGSEDNLRRLLGGQVQLTLLQGGSVPLEDVQVVTPLHREYVLVVVRRGGEIQTVSDLVGKRVSLGRVGSGNRKSAEQLLKYYALEPADVLDNEQYFKNLLDAEAKLDAAIVTSGLENPDLREVLGTGEFDLLSLANADAIATIDPYFRAETVPVSVFSVRPSTPRERITTVATTAFLVVRPGASDKLVQAALKAVHEDRLRLRYPTLISRAEAPKWVPSQLHPTAQRYFYPSDQIGFVANVMESAAAIKELLFALGAGMYLLWRRWRRLKELELLEAISEQKEHLDVLLEKTLSIESEQLASDDPIRLRAMIAEVTQLKLRALHEFTEEELRGDQAFSIFLTQCSSLINRLQLRILEITSQRDA